MCSALTIAKGFITLFVWLIDLQRVRNECVSECVCVGWVGGWWGGCARV